MTNKRTVLQPLLKRLVVVVSCAILQACSGIWTLQSQQLSTGIVSATQAKTTESIASLPLPVSNVVGDPAPAILPQGVFGSATTSGQKIVKTNLLTTLSSGAEPHSSLSISTSPAIKPSVLIYDSQSNRTYLGSLGIDATESVQTWEALLRKHSISYKILKSSWDLETAPPGALILPSSVALSDQEKQAIVLFQRKGGAIISTWLSGVRDELGNWRGFSFMENALGAKVIGTTEENEDDTYLIPHGDNPVSHNLPAGLRVWMARTKGWYPLRLAGKQSAAEFMDWSRTVTIGKPSSAIVFDERIHITGKKSRLVALGFPERLWASTDAKNLEPLILDALTWVMRQPSAYLAAWPNPYTSAFSLAIDVADTMAEGDLNYGKLTGDLGGKATYFVLTEQAALSSQLLQKIQAEGHEIGYLGDKFEEFKDQSTGAQSKRIDTMVRELKNAGIKIEDPVGFHPPMESYDKATERIVRDRKFGYMIAGLDATESRLPFVIDSDGKNPFVVLPRTQSDPDDLVSQGDPAVGLKLFFSELNLAEKMAGLSVTRLSNRSSLTASQISELSQYL